MNGAHAESGVSNTPSERTPLLPSRRPTQEANHDASETNSPSVPHIGTFAADIQIEDLATYNVDALYPSALPSRPARTAFALCVLLHYRKSILGGTISRGRDVWAQWNEESRHSVAVRDLDALAMRVWSEYLEDAGPADEIAEVLWSAFPIDVYTTRTVRVIDFLAAGHASDDLTSHPLVHLSLADTWKYGRPSTREGDSAVSTFLRFVDRCCAPRVLCIIDIATHLAYLWILYVFVNRRSNLGWPRHSFILLSALGKLASPWESGSWIPSLLVLVSFLSWFPDTPGFGSTGLAGVLYAVYLEVIYLHLPTQPNSPLSLLRPDQVLPLAVLSWRGLRSLLMPPLFFFPGLVLSFVLFTQSFEPWIPRIWSFTTSVDGGPTDTQVMFLFLFFTFFLLLCLSLIYGLIASPFLATSQDLEPSAWDRYTRPVGMEARRAFIRNVRLYGADNYIPAPLNLLRVVLVRIPQIALMVLRKYGAANRIATLDKSLWRITMGPLGVVVSTLWLWHLRND